MADARDSCRPVTLPDGEVIRVRGSEPMNEEDVKALGALIAAARRLHAERDPDGVMAARREESIRRIRERNRRMHGDEVDRG